MTAGLKTIDPHFFKIYFVGGVLSLYELYWLLSLRLLQVLPLLLLVWLAVT